MIFHDGDVAAEPVRYLVLQARRIGYGPTVELTRNAAARQIIDELQTKAVRAVENLELFHGRPVCKSVEHDPVHHRGVATRIRLLALVDVGCVVPTPHVARRHGVQPIRAPNAPKFGDDTALSCHQQRG